MKHGSRPTYRCTYRFQRSLQAEKPSSSITLNSKGHWGPFILLCPCPRCITPSARVLGLPIAPQGFLWKCILHRRSSPRLFPHWLFFLIAFLAVGSILITVRATGTETQDLLWLQVGTKDKLLLGICFSYGLTKFSLATHGGKARDLITSALG